MTQLDEAVPGDRSSTGRVDAVVVGAGFAGLYMVYALRALGLRVRGIEAGSDVGGTWYWNRYPGARCDITSSLYSYAFDEQLQQEWSWSEKYATQPEIQRYLRHVAERFDLRGLFTFDTRVTSAVLQPDETWVVSTDTGEQIAASYCVMATGCLSQARLPDLPRLADTSLPVHHTGDWPREGVDVAGLRVGVVGTGSSGIQLIPQVAAVAEHLTVFQRTPAFTVPARNEPVTAEEERRIKSQYGPIRAGWRAGDLIGLGEPVHPGSLCRRDVLTWDESADQHQQEYTIRWERGGAALTATYSDVLVDPAANEVAADFVRAKIAGIVEDPDTAAMLTPRGFPIGAKRLCVDTDYYATYNRSNVQLVDVRSDPIVRVDDDGLTTGSGRHHELDVLLFATGFDAMTGALLAMDIRGRNGLPLAQAWADGPRAYLGLAVHGFPNLFLLTGPGSPSVLGNMVAHIEQHVEYVGRLIAESREAGVAVIEAEAHAQQEWSELVTLTAAGTLFPQANSWYVGANVPGKPRVFMPYVGGLGIYRTQCEELRADGYRGFDRRPSAVREASGTARAAR